MHGHVGAAAHGDADIGRSQGGGVVDAIANHGHHGILAQPVDQRRLVCRQHFGMGLMNAQGLGHRLHAAAVVAADQMAVDTLSAEGCDGLQGALLEGVAKGEQAQHPGFRRQFQQPGQGTPLGLPGSGFIEQHLILQPVLFQQALVAQGQLPLADLPGNTAPGQGFAMADRWQVQLLLTAGIQHRLGQRVFATQLQGAGQLQQLCAVVIHGSQVGDTRCARGQGAGLVEGHPGHPMGDLQGFGVLDQDAVTRRHPGAGHDRRGRGQAQGAGAGDHQYRHGIEQCGFQAGAQQ